MLPKIDSIEWTEIWNLEKKINALNEAIQGLILHDTECHHPKEYSEPNVKQRRKKSDAK